MSVDNHRGNEAEHHGRLFVRGIQIEEDEDLCQIMLNHF